MSKGKSDSLISELEQAKNNINQIVSNLDNNLQSMGTRVSELVTLKQNARELEQADYNSASWFSKCVRTVSGLKYVFVTHEDKLPSKIIEENKNIFRSVDKNLINAANKSEPLAKILAQELDQTLNNLSDKKNLTPAQSQKLTELNEQFNKWATSRQSVKIFKHKEVASADPLQNQLSELTQIKNNMKQFLDNNASTVELARIAKEVGALHESVPKTFFEKLNTPWKKVTALFNTDSVTKLLKNTEQTTEQLAAITQRLERAGRNIENALTLDTQIAENKINKYKGGQSEVKNAQSEATLKRGTSERADVRESALNNMQQENRPKNTQNLSNQNNARNSVNAGRAESMSNPNSPRSSEYRTSNANIPQVEGRNNDVNLGLQQASPRNSQMRSNESARPASEANFPPPPPPPPPLAMQSPRSSQFRGGADEDVKQNLNSNIGDVSFAPPPPPPPPPPPFMQSSKEPSSRENLNEQNRPDARSDLLKAIQGGTKLRNAPNSNDQKNIENSPSRETGFNTKLLDKFKNLDTKDKSSDLNSISDSDWGDENSKRSSVNMKQDTNTESRVSNDRQAQNENVTRASESNLNTPHASPRNSQMQGNPDTTSRPVSESGFPPPPPAPPPPSPSMQSSDERTNQAGRANLLESIRGGTKLKSTAGPAQNPDDSKGKVGASKNFAETLKSRFKNVNPDGPSR